MCFINKFQKMPSQSKAIRNGKTENFINELQNEDNLWKKSAPEKSPMTDRKISVLQILLKLPK